jgi:hypothetical protein
MAERRKSLRTRTLRSGRIVLNNRRSVLDCMIRNLSPSGACLLVPSVVGVPPSFELLIDGEPAPRQCQVVWHDQQRLGIEFRRA